MWLLVMPRNFDPNTSSTDHMGFVAGDTLEIEGGVDIDSIVVSFSEMAFTDYLAGWLQGRSDYANNYDNFSAYFYREKKEKKGEGFI